MTVCLEATFTKTWIKGMRSISDQLQTQTVSVGIKIRRFSDKAKRHTHPKDGQKDPKQVFMITANEFVGV